MSRCKLKILVTFIAILLSERYEIQQLFSCVHSTEGYIRYGAVSVLVLGKYTFNWAVETQSVWSGISEYNPL